jgi:thiol:disulfide interchange protein DsbD
MPVITAKKLTVATFVVGLWIPLVGLQAATGEKCVASADCYANRHSFNPFATIAQLDQLLRGNIVGDEFLHPDVAYVLSPEVGDSKTIVVRWTIAVGYYLYRDKFKFALKDGSGVELGAIKLPPGKVKEDEFFGRVEVFYKQVAATITLQRNATDSTEIMLDVGYQGCAEVGLCYPPITKAVPLTLPPTPN